MIVGAAGSRQPAAGLAGRPHQVLGLGGGVAQQRGTAVDVSNPTDRPLMPSAHPRPFVPSSSAVATQLRPMRLLICKESRQLSVHGCAESGEQQRAK